MTAKRDESSTEKSFREQVEAALAVKGVRPVAAATRAGLNRDAIRSVLRGRKPSIGRAEAICRALGFRTVLGEAEPAERPKTAKLPLDNRSRRTLRVRTLSSRGRADEFRRRSDELRGS